MRILTFLAALAMTPSASLAATVTGTDWELLAIDGVFIDARAILRIEEDGTVSGKAPCNSWSSQNEAKLPALSLNGIAATRMACDQLDKEQQFFDALSIMTEVRLDGTRNLILSGPDGRTMEFVLEVMNSMTRCKTCLPKD